MAALYCGLLRIGTDAFGAVAAALRDLTAEHSNPSSEGWCNADHPGFLAVGYGTSKEQDETDHHAASLD